MRSGAVALAQGRSSAYRWVVVAACFVFMLPFWGSQSTFSVFIGPLSEAFGGSRGLVSLAFTFTLVVAAVVGIGMGLVADKKGPRAVTVLGGLFMGAGFLLASRASHLWQLYLSLGVMQGLGMAGAFIVPTITISKWFQSQRGLALGIAFTGIGVGYMLGPPLASYLIAYYGWRTAYVILGAVVLLLPLSLSPLLRLPPQQATPAGPKGPASEGPTLRQALAGSPFWIVLTVWGLQGLAVMSLVTHLVPFATDHAISLSAAATLLTVYGVATTVARSAFGSLADRLGTKPAFLLCVILQGGALLGFLLGRGLAEFYVMAALLGLGFSGSDTVITRESPELFGTASLGSIMGAILIGWRIGAALGSPVAGFIFDSTGAYTISLVIAFVCVMVGGLLFLLGLRGKARSAPAR